MNIDMYANYVFQRFFDVDDSDLKNKAKSILKPHLKEVRAIPFAKHIVTKLG